MDRSVGILSVKEDSQGMAGKSLKISCKRFRMESKKAPEMQTHWQVVQKQKQ